MYCQGTSKPKPGVVDLFHVSRELSSLDYCLVIQSIVRSTTTERLSSGGDSEHLSKRMMVKIQKTEK